MVKLCSFRQLITPGILKQALSLPDSCSCAVYPATDSKVKHCGAPSVTSPETAPEDVPLWNRISLQLCAAAQALYDRFLHDRCADLTIRLSPLVLPRPCLSAPAAFCCGSSRAHLKPVSAWHGCAWQRSYPRGGGTAPAICCIDDIPPAGLWSGLHLLVLLSMQSVMKGI